MPLEEVPRLETVVDLKFRSIYPVYLKLWSWATKNTNNFNDVFTYFKKWEGQEYEMIFTDPHVKEVFGSNVIEFINYVYFYHKPPQFQLTRVEVECKTIITQFYSIIINNYHFYFMECANTIILCNVYFNQQSEEYFNIQDFLGSDYPYSKNTKDDACVQYTNNVWFTNTNTPFMAYPDGIVNNKRAVNRSHNIPFYSDLQKSYFMNYHYIDSSDEWYQGCKTVISAENPQFTWEFVEGVAGNEKIVVVTGYRKTLMI